MSVLLCSSNATLQEQLAEAIKTLPADVQRKMKYLSILDSKAEDMTRTLDSARNRILQAEKSAEDSDVFLPDLELVRTTEVEIDHVLQEKLAVMHDARQIVDAYLLRLEGDIFKFRDVLESQGIQPDAPVGGETTDYVSINGGSRRFSAAGLVGRRTKRMRYMEVESSDSDSGGSEAHTQVDFNDHSNEHVDDQDTQDDQDDGDSEYE